MSCFQYAISQSDSVNNKCTKHWHVEMTYEQKKANLFIGLGYMQQLARTKLEKREILLFVS